MNKTIFLIITALLMGMMSAACNDKSATSDADDDEKSADIATQCDNAVRRIAEDPSDANIIDGFDVLLKACSALNDTEKNTEEYENIEKAAVNLCTWILQYRKQNANINPRLNDKLQTSKTIIAQVAYNLQ